MEKFENLPTKDRIYLSLATLFGVGYTALASGTAASLFAVLLFIIVRNQTSFFLLTVISIVSAFACSSRAEELFKVKDCKKIVIDDFCGMLITFLFIPFDWRFIITGFFIFRIFDMLKVPPADKLEEYPGAAGIVGDDLVAGIYANIILHLAKLAVNTFS